MHNPEAPEFRGGKMRRRPRQQPHRIKRRNGKRGEEEQPGHVALVLAREPPTQSPEQQDYPKEQPYRQQYLPESSQIEILKSLHAEPHPPILQATVDTDIFASHTAEHD